MKRALVLPHAIDRNGVAHYPWPGCGGNCRQGRERCDCATELANDIHPDADRFTTPDMTAEDRRYRARALCRALAAAVGAWASFALILWIAAHH